MKSTPAPASPPRRPIFDVRGALALSAFFLAFLLPPAGLAANIIRQRRRLKSLRPPSKLARAGIIISSILLAPFIFFIGLYIALGGLRGNAAQNIEQPFEQHLMQLGATKICGSGDNGYGTSNKTPWYKAYYLVPETPELTSDLSATVAGLGFPLKQNTAYITALKRNGDTASTLYGKEQFNPKSDYLVSYQRDSSFSVIVNRETAVNIYCGFTDYGKKKSTGNGKAIITVLVNAPELK